MSPALFYFMNFRVDADTCEALMFGKRQPAPTIPERSIRDTLFGDAPMEAWPGPHGTTNEQPWSWFVQAREALAKGRTADAVALWKNIAAESGLETRHYAQAWHFLRANGVQPPAAEAKRLLGVIVEVPVEDGVDLLAAYPDGTARYYNYSGAGVVWEHPDDSLDGTIGALLNAGQKILNVIGPWTDERPGPPAAGAIRLSMLAPSGLHFGQGPFDALANDPMAKPAVNAAIALMQQLIAKSEQQTA